MINIFEYLTTYVADKYTNCLAIYVFILTKKLNYLHIDDMISNFKGYNNFEEKLQLVL